MDVGALKHSLNQLVLVESSLAHGSFVACSVTIGTEMNALLEKGRVHGSRFIPSGSSSYNRKTDDKPR